MAKRIKEGDFVVLKKGTVFNAMLNNDSCLLQFYKERLKHEREYEVLFLFKRHPERGAESELCSECIFNNDCSYDIIVLRGLEAYGWCAHIFDKVEK